MSQSLPSKVLFQSFLQYLFSPNCVHCGSFFVEDTLLCDECFRSRLYPRLQQQLQHPLVSVIPRHYYLFAWNPQESDLLSEMIYRLKGNRAWPAWEYYGKLLYYYVSDYLDWGEFQALVPLAGSKPSSVHAQILATVLSKHSGLPVWDVLQKRTLQQQKKLSAVDRKHQSQIGLKGQLPEHFTKLIFVDDVLTTGQSYEQSRKALNANSEDVILTLFYRSRRR
ncbi:ComF family protein [Pseudobdellovibrio exovorus]|uniref:Phosphoribosyltransferase domain-containing protein n=1 Tax=Pseudobdellovibrio exovorus JSS TaxID=1184267 RepID=M4VU51_9BACT|nr:hypothetical protein [Pseudobdellovibrio exovorus]AGH96744.1 hypothetical protein A11Q_2528 [Pseudobdellovibrio exovorus JSS]